MKTLRMATPSLAIIRGMADQWEDDYLAREKRAKGAAEALHSGAMDGLTPTPGALHDARDYVDGRRTLDEIIEDVRHRHTRRPKGGSQRHPRRDLRAQQVHHRSRPVVDKLIATASARTDILSEAVGTWVGYFENADTAILCAALRGLPDLDWWIAVGARRRSQPDHRTPAPGHRAER